MVFFRCGNVENPALETLAVFKLVDVDELIFDRVAGRDWRLVGLDISFSLSVWFPNSGGTQIEDGVTDGLGIWAPNISSSARSTISSSGISADDERPGGYGIDELDGLRRVWRCFGGGIAPYGLGTPDVSFEMSSL